MPLNELAPVTGQPRRIELPAVAVDVPAGKTLYVVASPLSETFAGMGSRTPGAVVLQDAVAPPARRSRSVEEVALAPVPRNLRRFRDGPWSPLQPADA